MFKSVMRKIIGTKNDREIKRIRKIVKKINSLEERYEKFTDEELKNCTAEFKERLKLGVSLDSLLPEGFAVVREASKRILGMRHYDVQLIGGIVLHEGKITEMKTGEGKTLVATCPVYLNALTGKGVHVVTVNEYLAKRDRDTMNKVYEFLGLTSSVLIGTMATEEKKQAYAADITYGTNSEFGFDYLRDNMVKNINVKVQKKLNFCIVDEIDSILIDEARTPLVISGAEGASSKVYEDFFKMVEKLERSYKTEGIKDIKIKKEMNIPDEDWGDYEVDEKGKVVVLTKKGITKVEKMFNIENLYAPQYIELTHYLNQALKAKELYTKDKDYLLKEGKIVIIDSFTGRALDGRRYSEGLHQAIEAREGVEIAGENQTLARITLQNYFRMYEKLSGMTGTGETEAAEFAHIYNLQVLVIPTHVPVQRKDREDLVYRTKEEKLNGILEKVFDLYVEGQPVLIGTASIESSEKLSEELTKKSIPHNVLNAKYHEKEAEIIAQAGRYRGVTIATNMAGRGTDIMLGGNPEFLAQKEFQEFPEKEYEELLKKYEKFCKIEKEQVKEVGGLFILGTEHHESRRIDNQLRGRAGRQGDLGESQFYLSIEDELMKLFAGDRLSRAMDRIGIKKGEGINHKIINNAIESAQSKIESRNFGIRKNLLEFDDVMNKQREIIYESRNVTLEKNDIKENILKIFEEVVEKNVIEKFLGDKTEWNIEGLAKNMEILFGIEITDLEEYKTMSIEEYIEKLFKEAEIKYNEKETKVGAPIMRALEKHILLEIVDTRWREHLKNLDALRDSIHLRSYGQKDPVIEYKILAGDMYMKMLDLIKIGVASFLSKVEINLEEKHNEN